MRPVVALLLALLLAPVARADGPPPGQLFRGQASLPWSSELQTCVARGVNELGPTGWWSQLPLELRQRLHRGGTESPFPTARVGGISAPDREVRLLGVERQGWMAVRVRYALADRPDPSAANLVLFLLPRNGRVEFERAPDFATPLSPGLSGVLAGDAPGLDVCHRYDCAARAPVTLTPAAWERVRAVFRPAPADAAEERARVAQAVALMEREVAPQAGTAQDRGGWAGNFYGVGMDGQQDCLDEAANTTTTLGLLVRAGLLRFHRPEVTHGRGFLAGSHFAASMRELQSGQLWIVDSWVGDNGELPAVQTLEDWRR